MDQVSKDRQTSMFTATWPQGCKKLAEWYINEPMQIMIGDNDISSNKDITQHIEIVNSDDDRKSAFKRILGQLGWEGNCLCFCNTKRKCRDLAWELNEDKYSKLSAVELHGDLDQRQR